MTLIIALFLAIAAGAAFFPLASGPDEPGHYIHAAAVVRGQPAELTPLVPASIDVLHRFAGCLAFKPDVTAVCQLDATVPDPSAIVVSDTGAGYYNPVFYGWVGLASLLDPTETGLYGARILAGLVTASIFGWSASFLLRRAASRWATIPVLLVATPMVVYLGAVLNPSAWEIVTAFGATGSAWAILFARTGSLAKWTEAHSLLLVSGSLMIVSRGLSPAFFVLLLLTVVIAAGWRRTIAALRAPTIWAVLGPLVVVGVASLTWVAIVGTNYVGVTRPASLRDGIRFIPVFYQDAFGQLRMMYGYLGWVDVPPPDVLVIAWVGAVTAFAFVSFCAAPTTGRWAIVVAASVAILLPGVVAGTQWSGAGWQGRYTMPLIVVLLLVAGLSGDAVFARSGSESSLSGSLGRVGGVLALILFVVGCLTMFALAARRYLVGMTGPLLAPPVWLPPLPPLLLACCAVVGLGVFAAVAARGPVAERSRVAASGADAE
jgi:hypothetical protein